MESLHENPPSLRLIIKPIIVSQFHVLLEFDETLFIWGITEMNKLVVLSIIAGVILGFQLVSWSANQGTVVDRLEDLEKENKELRDMIKELRQRLDELEKGGEAEEEAEKKEEQADKKVKKEKEAQKKEEAPRDPDDSMMTERSGSMDAQGGGGKGIEWLPSLEGEEFRLGGRLQLNFFDPEGGDDLPPIIRENPGGTLGLDELRVYLDGDFSNDIRFYGMFDVDVDGADLKEAYVDFEDLPLNSEVRAGLQPRFFRPSRYTEYYPLAGLAFWRSRDLGVTWRGNYAPFEIYAAFMNGIVLDTREVGKDDSDYVIGEDESSIDLNGDKEFMAGVGFRHDFGDYGRFKLLVYGLLGELSMEEVEFLFTNVPGYPLSLDDERELIGVNFDYKIGEWDFFAQAIAARDGELERSAWYAELSYKFEFKGLRYLDALRPLLRYGELDTNLTPSAFSRTGSLTWDRQQWAFALISEITDNVFFRTEYLLNEEDTNGPGFSNNELLLQLEVQF